MRFFTALLIFFLVWGNHAFVHGRQEERQGTDSPRSNSFWNAGEVWFGTESQTANLKDREGNSLEMIPFFAGLAWDINSSLGLEEHRGKVQFAAEAFLTYIAQPEKGGSAGFFLALRYVYPVLKKLSVYLQFGSGPAYFGVETHEQGNAGFNFLDQTGGGIQYFFAKDKAVSVGYRRFHISNLGIREPNGGINGDSILVSLSCFF